MNRRQKEFSELKIGDEFWIDWNDRISFIKQLSILESLYDNCFNNVEKRLSCYVSDETKVWVE